MTPARTSSSPSQNSGGGRASTRRCQYYIDVNGNGGWVGAEASKQTPPGCFGKKLVHSQIVYIL